MSLPGPIESASNPFELTVNVREDPLGFTMVETSVIEDQYIVFGVQKSLTAGGGSSGGGGAGDEGGDAGPPPPSWTPKSLVVEELTNTGLTYSPEHFSFSGRYAASLFGNAKIQYLKADQKTIVTVYSWSDVPEPTDPDFFSLILFQDSGVRTTTARYKATAVIEKDEMGVKTEETISSEFTQIVTNDWTSGRDALVDSTNPGGTDG
ncbi:hypothetical protein [Vibrio phage vB_pir03]|nr:hypothetical protein [Vibrio phage vB_pir03]